jgi:hypothetical protein
MNAEAISLPFAVAVPFFAGLALLSATLTSAAPLV